MIAISKHFKQDPASPGKVFDTRKGEWLDINNTHARVLVYEDMVKTWFLEVAKYLTMFVGQKFMVDNEEFDPNEAGFVILQIATSYIEGKQQYVLGCSSMGLSKDISVKGMKKIFNINEREANDFYDQVRCGLFHDGITRKKVWLHNDFEPLEFTSNNIKVSPNKFLSVIEEDFNDYINRLKAGNDYDLINNFNKIWNEKH